MTPISDRSRSKAKHVLTTLSSENLREIQSRASSNSFFMPMTYSVSSESTIVAPISYDPKMLPV